jgi:hypothetical protein
MSRPQQAASRNSTVFTIDSDKNIAAHAEIPAGSDNLQSFATEKELAKLTTERPVFRLVDGCRVSSTDRPPA